MLSEMIEQTIARELPHLRGLDTERYEEGKWTPKEELGHLIDSAANNHIRFVLGSIEGSFSGPGYAQDQWVDLHGYRDMPLDDLLELWTRYNRLLARVVERIPDAGLDGQMTIGSEPPVTLRFVIEDYVHHMQGHIDHMLGRDV